MLRYVFWAVCALLLANSAYVALTMGVHTGVALMPLIAVVFGLLAAFYNALVPLTKSGLFKAGKILFFCAIIAAFCMCAALFLAGRTAAPSFGEKGVIVLGAGAQNGKVSVVLKIRLDAALAYHAQNPAALIIVSGGTESNPKQSEAELMKQYLVENGVPPKLIIEEDRSTSSRENFLFCAQLLSEKGIALSDSFVFITNDFHCFRSMQYAKQAGFTNITALATKTPLVTIVPNYLREILATVDYYLFYREA